ncbi:hypothetical protein AWZ03_003080 [Drosophila navojoa]|uniref:Uncharacterized protein n=1 Tax=Drosophila navojoa TaxID=7232 RepID=A0A484BRU5_DRONA|nr:hypothetical protein AWZ03_003080 [Drosophila navojoa]
MFANISHDNNMAIIRQQQRTKRNSWLQVLNSLLLQQIGKGAGKWNAARVAAVATQLHIAAVVSTPVLRVAINIDKLKCAIDIDYIVTVRFTQQ